jgi:ribosomal protein S12 methylthiotransferase
MLTALDGVAREFGGGWLRLMYAYPTNFTDEMIEAIASLSNVVKYIDIPLQHISDRMLKLMRRQVGRAEQEALMHRLRERIPGLAVRTTFITGFPGETEDDHRELLDFIEDYQFDMLGVFQYSKEPGTVAGTMDEDPSLHVPAEIKRQREEEIMLRQQRIAFENAQYVAEQRCQFDVLIDGEGPRDDSSNGGDEQLYVGRCYHQAPQVDSLTYVQSVEPLSPGELVRCTIVDADGYDLIARPTEQLERTLSLPIMQ